MHKRFKKPKDKEAVMGLLVNGIWQDKWYDTKEHGGRFMRQESQIRNWVTKDGSAGPSGRGGFTAESGRYHLYVSLACPWAHRTLIMRQLKSLQDHVSVSVVEPLMLEHGWTFGESRPDHLFGSDCLYEIYQRADEQYTGRVTVPVLWDKRQNTMVSNESADIIRMFNSAFNEITGNTDDYYPQVLRHKIDSINEQIYDGVNNGVYRAGFATSQKAYEEGYAAVFETLDGIEERLAKQRYLVGDTLTEADWRLFTTLIRFDAVYFGHFKCNRQQLKEYHHISNYVRELFQIEGVRDTVDMRYIKAHYYASHRTINPTQVIPAGQEDHDFDAPHDRGRFPVIEAA
jgi:putative glutathione S-transferase